MKTPTRLEFILSWIQSQWHKQILCRVGRHHIVKLFADDEQPNPEGCIYCGIGFTYMDDEDSES